MVEHRKIQEMGGGTALMSLPKDWVRRNNLRKGSAVTVEVLANNCLLVYPIVREEPEPRRAVIHYPAEYIDALVNDVTGAYLFGYDIVKIHGERRVSYEDREVIKKAVQHLVGFEIVEEDAYSITAQFLPEPTTLDPRKIFRRMHIIAQGMHCDAITSLVEGDKLLAKLVLHRDDEVDRLYFLLVRLIRSAILDPQLSAKHGLSPIDHLDQRVAANLLETIGDASADIASESLKMSDEHLQENIREDLKRLMGILERMQESAVRSFLERSAKEAREVVGEHKNLTEILGRLTETTRQELSGDRSSLLTIFSLIDRISRCHVDIADLTVPTSTLVETKRYA